jgi:hypothetical protein
MAAKEPVHFLRLVSADQTKEATMLERLFARNVPEERIEDAVDHGKAVEERDVLRTRSAVILERLARKQAAARQQEAEARRVAREAADRITDEPAAMPAEPGEAAQTAAEEASAQSAEETAASGGTAQQDHDAMAAAQTEQSSSGMAETPGGTAPAGQGGYFSDDAPLRDDAGDRPEARFEAPRTEPPAADEGFAAEPFAEPEEPESAEPAPTGPATAEPAAESGPEHASPDIHDDPEALERIRQKAEEAKARIAARLEQMEAEEASADEPSSGRIDLGEDTPPVSPDDSTD